MARAKRAGLSIEREIKGNAHRAKLLGALLAPGVNLLPPSSTMFIWGLGPVLQFQSASATSLGAGKWEIGPAAGGR
jgi:hypothetical protein